MITLILATMNFIHAVLFGVLTQPDLEKWTVNSKMNFLKLFIQSGAFIAISFETSKWLGLSFLFASLVSNFGQYMADLATRSRTLAATGYGPLEDIALPSIVASLFPKYQTPVVAIAINLFFALILVNFRFAYLVEFSTYFQCIVLLLETLGFLWLKFKEPEAERPFQVLFKSNSAHNCSGSMRESRRIFGCIPHCYCGGHQDDTISVVCYHCCAGCQCDCHSNLLCENGTCEATN